MAAASVPTNLAQMSPPTQIRVTRRSRAYWRVTIDNPPINVMDPEMVKQWQETVNALEADDMTREITERLEGSR